VRGVLNPWDGKGPPIELQGGDSLQHGRDSFRRGVAKVVKNGQKGAAPIAREGIEKSGDGRCPISKVGMKCQRVAGLNYRP